MPILLGLKADRVRLCQEVAVAVPAHLVSHGDGECGDVDDGGDGDSDDNNDELVTSDPVLEK